MTHPGSEIITWCDFATSRNANRFRSEDHELLLAEYVCHLNGVHRNIGPPGVRCALTKDLITSDVIDEWAKHLASLWAGQRRQPFRWRRAIESEQEQLAELLTTFMPEDAVAASVWERRSAADITDVLDLGSSAQHWEWATDEGRAVSLALMEDRSPTGSYDELEAPGVFCWVPS